MHQKPNYLYFKNHKNKHRNLTVWNNQESNEPKNYHKKMAKIQIWQRINTLKKYQNSWNYL